MPYIKVTNDELYHYGLPRRSGRYKWGSGDRPFQGDNIGGSLISRRLQGQHNIDERAKKSAAQLKDEYENPMRTSVRDMNERIKKLSTMSADRVVNGPLKERPGKTLLDLDRKHQDEARDNTPEEDPTQRYKDVIKKMTDINNDNVAKGKELKRRLDEAEGKLKKQNESKADKSNDKTPEKPADPNSRDLYGKDVTKMSDKELQSYLSRKQMENKYRGYNPTKYDQLRTTAKGAKAAQEAASKFMDNYYKEKHKAEKARIDFSGVSDQDLQRAVNRMRLEQSYRDLAPDVISDGERKAKHAMNTIGTVLSVSEPIINVAESMSILFGYRR